MSFSKYIRTYLYSITDLQKLDHKISLLNREDNPIVSLTSVPNRLGEIKATLISLLKQTKPPKEIQINLGENLFENKKIPDFLKNLKLVKIFWVKNDFGPATKFIPTLERFSNGEQLIIVCDDDMYYPNNLIESLSLADENSKRKSSFCINGFKIPSNLKSASIPSDKAIKIGQKRIGVVEGCGGYSLRGSFVELKSLKETQGAPDRSLFDDDIWISGHMSRKKTSKFQIVSGKRKSLINTIESAISGDRSKLQTQLMTYFKNDWDQEEIE